MLAFFGLPLSIFAQGSLTPPAAPAPSFKTLSQIEPRIDLQNAPASAVTTSDPNYHYIITQPGSYYLSSNVNVTKANGIAINAADVTLDLRGFQIITNSGASGGIFITGGGGAARATVRDGSIIGFAYGIGNDGLTPGCTVRNVAVSACTFRPLIIAGPGAVIDSCRVHGCSSETGIHLAQGSATVKNCTVENSAFSLAAIYAERGCSIIGCTVQNNSAPNGIGAAAGSALHNCVVTNNTLTDSGINVSTGSTLTNCSVTSNTALHGIFAIGSVLSQCNASANTSSAANSDGIRLVYSSANNCTAYANTNSSGNNADSGSGFFSNSTQLNGCIAYANRGHGFRGGDDAFSNCVSQNNGNGSTVTGFGFSMAAGTTFYNCLATSNTDYGIYAEDSCTVVNCTTRGTRGVGIGIRVGNRSRISGCTVNDNHFDGIQFISDCLISDNHVANNGSNMGGGDGIHSFGNENRIDNNSAQFNKGAGIRSNGPLDVVVRNTSLGQSPNYALTGNPYEGPLALPSTTTSPWANF